MYLKFRVSVCLGRGDGGDVVVSENVTEKELELLKKCRESNDEICGYPGLEDLYDNICSSAIDEARSYDYENDALYDDASCLVSFPDGI